jgi:CNT family concentrative nucleoside transporter
MERLVSFLGLFVMIGLAWLMSSHRRKVSLRIIGGGLALQMVFAVVIIRTTPGEIAFRTIGDFFTNMIGYVDQGSTFVFGMDREYEVPVTVSKNGVSSEIRFSEHRKPEWEAFVRSLRDHDGDLTVTVGESRRDVDVTAEDWETDLRAWLEQSIAIYRQSNLSRTRQLLTSFAFGVLPTIVFFAALMSMLYHLGVMQRVVKFFAWIMQKSLGTSGAESLSAAANIFVGQTEAPLVIRPYVGAMTASELMAVMVGGFATIAGGVLAAYVSFGIDAGHLVTASVISAPAALLIAKVMQPETEQPKTMGHVTIEVEKKDANLIGAAASGAADGMKLALNVAAMLIAFLALIAMLNGVIGWTGSLFGQDWTLENALSYIFWPLAWLMGIPSNDCFTAAELLGTKMVANEFVAYLNLGGMMKADPESLSPRTVTILTYALCGFANFGSIGIQLGGIGGIAPERRGDLARLGLRAMLGGTLAAFMTACVAGILI